MLRQRTKRTPDPEEGAATELATIEIPDVSDQLARMQDTANSAGAEKRAEKERKRLNQKKAEEVARCCGIRWPA